MICNHILGKAVYRKEKQANQKFTTVMKKNPETINQRTEVLRGVEFIDYHFLYFKINLFCVAISF